MELFYTKTEKVPEAGETVFLDETESTHCINVLRHRAGDEVNLIDGRGNLLKCRILDDGVTTLPDNRSKRRGRGQSCEIRLEVLSVTEGFGSHPYNLAMAVCPTKNMERYEWFVEKAVEVGLDCVVPVVGEHSERRVVNKERLNKIIVSAVKQSLKGTVPELWDCISVKEFCRGCSADLKLICYCGDEVERVYICDELQRFAAKCACAVVDGGGFPSVAVLVGPEGDFSGEEVAVALESGFKAVHLGSSRLRTETAALVATVLTASAFEKGL